MQSTAQYIGVLPGRNTTLATGKLRFSDQAADTDKGLEVEALNEMMEIFRLTWIHRESHVRPP